ncbi:hypothetical protein LMG27198_13150 [Methylocystis echinoides]|uniref:Uncharacterized protein n=1 Tax=Methylocystis echinoides TaxID=29468 RepID=A0A9W6GSL3_9HYPH|nr:hypothetical protein LMG27198_13150 [Methylocystis echinoides]
MTGSQGKADGETVAVHHDIYLGAQSSTRTANGVIRAPIATRFDKLARNFLAAVALASIRLWARYYECTT